MWNGISLPASVVQPGDEIADFVPRKSHAANSVYWIYFFASLKDGMKTFDRTRGAAFECDRWICKRF